MSALEWLPCLTVAYLLGSLPFSFLVARYFGVADVRRVGSGNVGATNVMRSAGKTAGVLAFLLDASKGALAAWLAEQWQPGGGAAPWAAVAAVLGHLFPIWLRFRGGKGVATGAGACLPLLPGATALALLVFAALLAGFRFVSLASLGATFVLAACAWLPGTPRPLSLAVTCIAVLIFLKHGENLARLWAGTERRVGAQPTEAELRATAAAPPEVQ
jgi:glycerol-3-phosphate acyltransferase PlsY